MAAPKTVATELITGLGILGIDPRSHLGFQPAEFRNVGPRDWESVVAVAQTVDHDTLVDSAYRNGLFFAAAADALRGRAARLVEWTGPTRSPGDEVAPIDLRVDHVFLVSCKYLSSITVNASPSHVFERLLSGGHGHRSGDWYQQVAPDRYRRLWRDTLAHLGRSGEATLPGEVGGAERKQVARELQGSPWPEHLAGRYLELCHEVSIRSAERWNDAIRSQGANAAESLLWRLLRIGSAPYFVLGSHRRAEPVRLRVASPWDWRQHFEFRRFEITPHIGGQPRVDWVARVTDHSGGGTDVEGHVEIRWSHGRFASPPEAKVYLDTPFVDSPGYWPLT